MKRKWRRLFLIGLFVSFFSTAVGSTLYVLSRLDVLTFFYSPTDLVRKNILSGFRLRLGGLVEEGSVDRSSGKMVSFRVTDLKQSILVRYTGILPALFREGQGVVVEGILGNEGVFIADRVMAKHDEVYMPPEVAESLKEKDI
ncbi:MAG: cytochrome c maturation protein CcmE [Alphaproteobacteria bacterium]|nr:cytochrome c maturation protein CcmE [Alphaproteobacteria bacterium]